MTKTISREIRLRNRPVGLPTESDFELVEVPIAEPREGEILVRNIYMSVDPYMRGRMDDLERSISKYYIPPFQLGETLDGGCVGRVVKSNRGKFQVGDYVSSFLGWREYFVSDGSGFTKIDPGVAPIQAYLGVLGMPGRTAYVGLLNIGQPKEGETVFVSAAAGTVGGVACQIAKIKGCRVVGSAGSDEKAAWLMEEAKLDAAFNYKRVDDLTAELKKHCPKGIDVYFDNVGGKHLEAAIGQMNKFGRIVLCGMISQYNATELPPGPNNLFLAITKRLTLKGFIIIDHFDQLTQFYDEVGKWVREGRIKWKETIVEGIENAPRAFIGLFKGENFGKMLVKIGPDPAV
jgi:NADPH-dependent curcumin reductase CurA